MEGPSTHLPDDRVQISAVVWGDLVEKLDVCARMWGVSRSKMVEIILETEVQGNFDEIGSFGAWLEENKYRVVGRRASWWVLGAMHDDETLGRSLKSGALKPR